MGVASKMERMNPCSSWSDLDGIDSCCYCYGVVYGVRNCRLANFVYLFFICVRNDTKRS